MPRYSATRAYFTVAEDAGAPIGAVGSAISSYTAGITDVDSGALKGIAIVASNEANGTWYYTTNGGTNWTVVGTVDATQSLLLADNANTRLYFAPSPADFNGSASAALTIGVGADFRGGRRQGDTAATGARALLGSHRRDRRHGERGGRHRELHALANEDTAVTANVITGTGGASDGQLRESGRTLTSVSKEQRHGYVFLAERHGDLYAERELQRLDSFTYTVTSGG